MTFTHSAAALPPCLINSHPGSRDGFFFFPENPRRKGSVPGTPPSYGLGNYGGQRAADHTTNEADAASCMNPAWPRTFQDSFYMPATHTF